MLGPTIFQLQNPHKANKNKKGDIYYEKNIVFFCVLLAIIVVAALAMPAILNNSEKNTEGENLSSEQVENESLVGKNVLNPLNLELEAFEKLPAEAVLKALAVEAKSKVGKSTSFELELKETEELLSLNYVISYYYGFNTCGEYVPEKVSDVISIDITAGKGNEDNIQDAEYMTFLALLINIYPDCVGFLDYKYLDYNFNRNFFPILIFCPDYAEYGYDTIYDYIDAALSHKEIIIENAYFIRFDTNRIEIGGSDTNLYDTIFNNTESK